MPLVRKGGISPAHRGRQNTNNIYPTYGSKNGYCRTDAQRLAHTLKGMDKPQDASGQIRPRCLLRQWEDTRQRANAARFPPKGCHGARRGLRSLPPFRSSRASTFLCNCCLRCAQSEAQTIRRSGQDPPPDGGSPRPAAAVMGCVPGAANMA